MREIHVRLRCYARSMSVVISHSSALDYWIRAALSGKPHPGPSRVLRVPDVDASAFRENLCSITSPMPRHVLVPDRASRNRIPGVVFHVWSGTLPPRSLVKIDERTFLSTPEFVFLQAAFQMPFVQLLQFGYELCALYTARLPGGELTELDRPIASVASIAHYLEGCAGSPGVKRARQVAKWILAHSRSPRESKFGISMTLPRAYGGQGVWGLELNVVIPLTKAEQKVAGKHHYEIDVYSELGETGLEYFGKDAHEGPIRETRDIRRESILLAKGITVHGVTKSQAENVMELERFAKLLKEARGERWRKPTPEQEQRMRKLLQELYSNQGRSLSNDSLLMW